MIVLTCERREMNVYLRREVDTKESSLIRRSINRVGVTSLFALKERKYLNIIDGFVWFALAYAKGYEQSLFPFRDSKGKEKQASEREIDCGSTGALAFKDVGDFHPRSLVYFCKGIPGLANRI